MKKKRSLFEELVEGFDAIQKEREGKITLRRVAVDKALVPSRMKDSERTNPGFSDEPGDKSV